MAALSPNFDPQFDDGGAPAAGYLLHTYATGTTTPLTTYQDQAATVPNTNPIVLDAAGRAKLWLVDSAEYRLHLTTPLGATVSGYPIDDVGGVSTAIDNTALDAALRADIASPASGKGAELVGFKRTEVNSAARTVLDAILDLLPSLKDWRHLAIGDDWTAALVAAWDAIKASGGGTLWVPNGTYGITSAALTYTPGVSINICGAGQGVTNFVKIAGTSTPVLDISLGIELEIFSEFSNFSVVGAAKSSSGLRLTNLGRFSLRNIKVTATNIAIENRGSLIISLYDVTCHSNNKGYSSVKHASVYCNLINIYGGGFFYNTDIGVDIGDAAAVTLNGVDFEVNGTAGNPFTGAVLVRDTCDDETGTSTVTFNGGWVERNHGTPITVQTCAGLRMAFRDFKFAFNDAGVGASIGAVNIVTLDNCDGNDSITIGGAGLSTISGSNLGNVIDTSAVRSIVASQVNGAVVPARTTVFGLVTETTIAGAVNVSSAGLTVGSGVMLSSSVPLLDNTGTGVATITNSPSAGNPTKWIRINDNGTLRFIPTW